MKPGDKVQVKSGILAGSKGFVQRMLPGTDGEKDKVMVAMGYAGSSTIFDVDELKVVVEEEDATK